MNFRLTVDLTRHLITAFGLIAISALQVLAAPVTDVKAAAPRAN